MAPQYIEVEHFMLDYTHSQTIVNMNDIYCINNAVLLVISAPSKLTIHALHVLFGFSDLPISGEQLIIKSA